MLFKKPIKRREFIKRLSILTGSSIISPFLQGFQNITFADLPPVSTLYISKNGTPVANMQKVVDMAGKIENLINQDDVVVLKPNLQHSKQGYTHTLATKALIDIILNRPGGFTGEIIIAENVQWRDPDDTDNCGWAVSSGDPRNNNWPDMNYNELINYYNENSHPNVTGAKLVNRNYPEISGPSSGQGYVTADYSISNSFGANGRICRLSYPIIQSAHSGKMIDTKNGVWEGGSYTDQQIKLIFLPTLNNHDGLSEDYAGVTSAVKCHIGFSRKAGTTEGIYGLHSVGYADSENVPRAVGESVGELITNIIQPTFYITVAEYSGWRGRSKDTAEQTKTIGLCSDPVALDYWMGKHVLGPCNGGSLSSFLDPSNENNFRKTLQGCQAKGVGTLDEEDIQVNLYDFNDPSITRVDIEKKIKEFKEGLATEQEVKELINEYMETN